MTITIIFRPLKYLRTIFSCIAVFVASGITAQSTISGRIIAADSHKPVVLANVFLSNTVIGTVSKEDGSFVLNDIPPGQYDLIVSYVGYAGYVRTFRTKDLPLVLEVVLTPKVVELQEVIVGAYERNGWEKWGDLFLEHFMGTSRFAEETRLVNKDDLRFRFDHKTNLLSVVALDRLVIENKALGYILRYELERFDYDTARHVFHFKGYPFFEEMHTDRASVQEKWMERRNEAYRGSLLHFMRSMYYDNLKENGFEVRKKLLVTEAEKKRVKPIWSELERIRKIYPVIPNKEQLYRQNYAADSISYFEHVVKAKAGEMIVPEIRVPRDSIVVRIDEQSMEIAFSGLLEVRYPTKKFPREFGRTSANAILNRGRFSFLAGEKLFSDMMLERDDLKPLTLYANGSYTNGMNLKVGFYWAWWEKMANKLPYDFQPSTK